MTWGDGIFVAAGNKGVILLSAEGKNWHVCPTGVNYDLYDLAWGNESFVACGEYGLIMHAPAETLAALIPTTAGCPWPWAAPLRL